MRFLRWFRDGLAGVAPRLRKALWPAGLGLGLGAEWAARSGQGLLAGGADLAVGWTLMACGLIGWSRRPQSRVGVLLALTGLAWFAGTFAGAHIDVLAALGAVVLTLHRGTLFHAVIAYPSGRLSDRLAVVVVSLGYAYAATLPLTRNDVATIIVVVLVLATTIRGYATAAGPDRLARVTAIAAAAAVALPLAGGSTGRLLGAGPAAERAVLWGYQVVLVLIAVGLLVDLLRGRWARAVVTRLVVDLGERAETDTLQARLAHALGDRSLAIAYWLPEASGYVDERGDRVMLPDAGSGRAVTVIEQRGDRIAALVHDAAVLDDAALIDAVASAARIALSNVRLQAAVRRQVAELAASRRRLLEASDAQRRRLQQELRVGVEQRLAGVGEQLERTLQAAGSAADSVAAVGLGDARRELQQALVELPELAAGIHPALLTEQGLGAALSSLAERTPVPVRLAVVPQPLPAAIETAVYFVCSEALTNVGKYAGASCVDVEVAVQDGVVRVLVADDGVGGADPSPGSGLSGLADRVEALGGRLFVDSPEGARAFGRRSPRGHRDEERPRPISTAGALPHATPATRRPAARASPHNPWARIVPATRSGNSRVPDRPAS